MVSVWSSPSCRTMTRHAKRMNQECESMQPLGSPVVPEVYWTLTSVCESISTAGGASAACASTRDAKSAASPTALPFVLPSASPSVPPSTQRIANAVPMSARTSLSIGTSSRSVTTARIPAWRSTKPASALR